MIPLLVVTIVAMVMAAGFCIGMFRRDNSVLGLMALGMALAAGFHCLAVRRPGEHVDLDWLIGYSQ